MLYITNTHKMKSWIMSNQFTNIHSSGAETHISMKRIVSDAFTIT